MTYEAAIQLIKQKQSLGVQPGLSRMLAAMEKTGSVQNKLQVIHVAGTNGKGTVCATVADGLRRAGYRVGVFSSPWVTDFREQITVDGRMISKQDFADCVEVFAKRGGLRCGRVRYGRCRRLHQCAGSSGSVRLC